MSAIDKAYRRNKKYQRKRAVQRCNNALSRLGINFFRVGFAMKHTDDNYEKGYDTGWSEAEAEAKAAQSAPVTTEQEQTNEAQ